MADSGDSVTTAALNDPSSPSAYTPPTPSSRVHEISGWRSVIVWPAAMLMKLWGMSLRFDATPEDVAAYSKCDVPVVMVGTPADYRDPENGVPGLARYWQIVPGVRAALFKKAGAFLGVGFLVAVG